MIYQGDNFPPEYRGAACLCNLRGNCVNFDVLDYSDAEVVARHGGNLLQASDLGFRAVDLKYGPDGSVYVCDWNARGMCHGSDYNASQPTGRIYRIAYGSPQPVPVDLGKLRDEELIALHDHENEWFVRRARLVLQHRAQIGALDATTVDRLSQRASDSTQSAVLRLRSLWTWQAVRGAGDSDFDLCMELMADSAPEIRAWAVRLKAEEQPVSAQTLDELVRLARRGSQSTDSARADIHAAPTRRRSTVRAGHGPATANHRYAAAQLAAIGVVCTGTAGRIETFGDCRTRRQRSRARS